MHIFITAPATPRKPRPIPAPLTREYIDNAVAVYLANGGAINAKT